MGANEDLYDATIRHQVQLLRYSKGQASSVAKILAESDKELTAKIAGQLTQVSEARLKALLGDVRKLRATAMEKVGGTIKKDMTELAGNEAEWELEAIKASVPAELKMTSVSPATMKALTGKPINGVPLDGWLGTLQANDITKIEQQLRLGITQGETLSQLTQRIRGTKANNYADGVTSMTTRNAQTIARTAVNHVSNSARQEVWNANSDIINGVRWVATLDGRTSGVCRGRDGHEYPINEGPRPPAHPGCRSTTTPILAGDRIVGDRPFVRDTRTRKVRETDFRTEAQNAAGAQWKGMSAGERNAAIKDQRAKWTAENIGQIPSSTTYDSWMRKQPLAFQEEVLGKAKAQIFRDGLPLDKFVDEKGKSFTIDQLKAQTTGDKLFVQQPGVGMKAKALLQQGLPGDKVLEAIKAEYPDASTSLASIASYKTELKKAGALEGGLLSPTGVSSAMKQAQSVADVVSHVESQLPAGAKAAIGGQWATVMGDLEGGAYGYYQAGKGVLLSGKKLSAISSVQAQQVTAHELGHLLHKQHDLLLPIADAEAMLATANGLAAAEKKLYAYYLSSMDELTAEVYAQAISPSMMTSQGLSAVSFNTQFESSITAAKQALKDKYPVPSVHAPAPSVGAPSVPFEVAGKHTTVGSLAKALLQQGLPDQQVLDSVLAQFPSAKTSKASLASYKVELKKAGLLPAKGPGVVVSGTPIPGVTAVPPAPPVVKPPHAPPAGPLPALHGQALDELTLDAISEVKSIVQGTGATAEEAIQFLQSEFAYSLKASKDMVEMAMWEMKQVTLDNLAAQATPVGKMPELLGKKLSTEAKGHVESVKGFLGVGMPNTYCEKFLKNLGYGSDTISALIDLSQYELNLAKSIEKPYMAEALKPTAAKLPDPPSMLGKKLSPAAQGYVDTAQKMLASGSKVEDIIKALWGKGYGLPQLNEMVELAQYNLYQVTGTPYVAASKTTAAVEATAAMPKPKLYGVSLGPVSNPLLKPLEEAVLAGQGDDALHEILQGAYGANYKKAAGQDMIDLAKYDAANGQHHLKGTIPQTAAPKKSAYSYTAPVKPELVPARVAATPREGIPPPPRFTSQQRREAVSFYDGGGINTNKLSKVNQEQAHLGLEALTEEEFAAVTAYTGGLYRSLNISLRGGKYAGDTALQAFVEAAQHGLDKMPKFKGLTSRGITQLTPAQLENMLATYTPGATVEEMAFTSSSEGERAAFSGKVYQKIQSKTGVWVDPYSRNPGEREVLYRPGTRFKVNSVSKDAVGNYIIAMEEV